jgi:hypothetical protein
MTLFISCRSEFVDFDEYVKNNMFNNKEILEDEIYVIHNFKYKSRVIYSEGETFFSIYDGPNGKQIFSIKYWTKVIPIEIIKNNDATWVKIKTEDQNQGWIKSFFLEVNARS